MLKDQGETNTEPSSETPPGVSRRGLFGVGAAAAVLFGGQPEEVARAGAPISAGVAVGIVGIFNGAGRLTWGALFGAQLIRRARRGFALLDFRHQTPR